MSRKRPINLDRDFDTLPKAVRQVLRECVWPIGDQDVDIPWAPAKVLVARIQRADAVMCTGDNTTPPYLINHAFRILRGEA